MSISNYEQNMQLAIFYSRTLRSSINIPIALTSSTLPFLAVSNRFSCCLDHCFRSFRSLFESILIDYKNTAALELNYFVFETSNLKLLIFESSSYL